MSAWGSIEVSSRRTWHYQSQGIGDPLLFIHGWGVDSKIWRQQVKYFSRFCRVLAVDLPGHGQSPWQEMSLENMARDICEIVRSLNMDRLHMAASSFGGLVALKLYEHYPGLFRSLALVGSHPKFIKSQDYPHGLTLAQTGKLASQLKTDYPQIVKVFFRFLFTGKERQSRRFKWIQTFRSTAAVPEQQALLSLLRILEETDLRETFRRIQIPVQFINGRDDYFFPAPLEEFLKNLLPGVRFQWFEDCGHFPFLIHPHEFNHVLEEFLNRC